MNYEGKWKFYSISTEVEGKTVEITAETADSLIESELDRAMVNQFKNWVLKVKEEGIVELGMFTAAMKQEEIDNALAQNGYIEGDHLYGFLNNWKVIDGGFCLMDDDNEWVKVSTDDGLIDLDFAKFQKVE